MRDIPVYVKVDDYKDALDLMNLIRAKIEDAKKTLEKVNSLRTEEDTELNLWAETIDNVEHKIDVLDRMLSEPASH